MLQAIPTSKQFRVFAVLAALVPACGSPPPGAEGGDPNYPAKGVEVWCNYNGQKGFAYLCIEEIICPKATAANVCSLYFSGDLNHADLWKESELMGPCNDGIVVAPDYPQAPCACDHGTPAQNDQLCDVPPPLDVYDYPDGYPYPPGTDPVDPTGPTTGDEDVTTGGEEPELKVYVCGDPLTVQQKCVFYNHVTDPLLDPDKLCWVNPQQPDNYTVCLSAFDDADALGKCTTKCTDFTEHAKGEIASHKPVDEPVPPDIDCVLDGIGEVPRVKTAGDVCDTDTNYLIAWGGTSVIRPFSASAVLGTSSGGSTSSRGLAGYIAYESADCTATQCDVTIDALEGVQQDVAGIFTDASGAQTSYLIEDLDFRMTQDVHGILNLRSRNVVFPADPFAGILWLDSYAVEGVPMGSWASPIFVSQAVGALSTNGDLTLNLTFNWADGAFTTTFVTY